MIFLRRLIHLSCYSLLLFILFSSNALHGQVCFAGMDTLRVLLVPDATIIPVGETLGMSVYVRNQTGLPQTGQFWTNLTLPNGKTYPSDETLLGPISGTIPADSTINRRITHEIPGNTPLGTYSYNAFVGPEFPVIFDTDLFDFKVVEGYITFESVFGGEDDDYSYSVQQTSDGGYVSVGYTRSFSSNPEVYLVKTDRYGVYEWSQTFHSNRHCFGSSVQQTTDGGYIIAGDSKDFFSSDVYLIKTYPDGNEEWSRTFGGDSYDYGESVQQTRDGGYVIVGTTQSFGAGYSDVYLIKTDPDGNEEWSRTFGSSDREHGQSVQQTSDGGYVIAGYTDPFAPTYSDFYLIKTDTDGYEEWSQTFGGDLYDCSYSVQQTSDGGYVIAGYTNSFGAGGYDVYLVKTDHGGNAEWMRPFGTNANEQGYSVYQTMDGGYVVAGNIDPYGYTKYNVYLVKTDPNGWEEWSRTFGGSGWDYGRSVQQTTDGGFVIGGYTNSYGAGGIDAYLIKTDPNGEL